jgi:hypothetical protein
VKIAGEPLITVVSAILSISSVFNPFLDAIWPAPEIWIVATESAPITVLLATLFEESAYHPYPIVDLIVMLTIIALVLEMGRLSVMWYKVDVLYPFPIAAAPVLEISTARARPMDPPFVPTGYVHHLLPLLPILNVTHDASQIVTAGEPPMDACSA